MKIWLIQYTVVIALYSFFFRLRFLVVVMLWGLVLSRSPTARTILHFLKRQMPKLYNFSVDLAVFISDYTFIFLFSRQRKRIIIRHMLLSKIKDVWLVKKLGQWQIINIPTDQQVNDYSTDDGSVVSNEYDCNIGDSDDDATENLVTDHL